MKTMKSWRGKRALQLVMTMILAFMMVPSAAFALNDPSPQEVSEPAELITEDQQTPQEDIELAELDVSASNTLSHKPPASPEEIASQEQTFETNAVDLTVYISAKKNYGFAYETLVLANAERAKVGVSPLTMDYRLLDTAMLRASEIAVLWNWQHYRPDGSYFTTAFPAEATSRNEILARGPRTPSGVIDTWMNSPAHREILLSNSYRSVGVGSVDDYYWSMNFSGMVAHDTGNPGNRQETVGIGISLGFCNYYDGDISLYNRYTFPETWEYPLLGTQTYATFRIEYPEGYFRPLPTSVVWSSSDPSVCVVSATGTITALNVGVAEISAYVPGIPVMSTVTLTVQPLPEPEPGSKPIDRLEGSNRYQTMQKIVSSGWSKSNVVIVATGDNFPDALAAASLAGIHDAPVVLTSPTSLSPEAEATIKQLGAKKIFIIGGDSAVSPSVASALSAITPDVTRLAGEGRYETAIKLYGAGKGSWGKTAIIASGNGFADALSISPFAYATKSPIFLADRASGLDAATIGAIKEGKFTKIIIVGGEAVVPSSVTNQLGLSQEQYTRLGGANRYETSAAIADYSVKNSNGQLGYNNAVFATGSNFPDALAGGAFSAVKKTVLVLVNETDDGGTYGIDTLIKPNASKIEKVHILGGYVTITSSLIDYIRWSIRE